MQILTFPLSQLVLPNHLANYSCWHLLYVGFFQTNQYSKITIGEEISSIKDKDGNGKLYQLEIGNFVCCYLTKAGE